MGTLDSVPRLLADASFNTYTANVKAQSVGDILLGCEFVPQTTYLQDRLSADLETTRTLAADQYAPFYRIFQYGTKWTEENLREGSYSVEDLSKQMSLMVEYAAELEKFPLQRTVGLISLQGKELQDELARIPERALIVMKRLLVGLARDKCAEACQQVIAAIKTLEEGSGDDVASPLACGASPGFTGRRRSRFSLLSIGSLAPREEREVYARVISSVAEQVAVIETQREEVELAYHVLARHRVRISGDEQFQYEVFQSKCKDLLDVRLPEAKAYLNDLEANVSTTLQTSLGPHQNLPLTCVSQYSEQLATFQLCSEPDAASGEASTFPPL